MSFPGMHMAKDGKEFTVRRTASCAGFSTPDRITLRIQKEKRKETAAQQETKPLTPFPEVPVIWHSSAGFRIVKVISALVVVIWHKGSWSFA